MARATKCPNCGEPVSAFAAGCAICGADLEAHRRRLAERPSVTDATRHVPNVRLPRVSSRTDPPDAALIAVVVLFLLVVPFFGTVLAALGAYDRNRRGLTTMRNVFLVLLALGLATFLIGPWQYGVLSLLF
ncbi:zinc ribbon domain-containing protein [Svornostia abyssi]|uniref:Zinc ribbon domain-containing protein n=1 Tax=Svornostia abyssi TaxID=2898438 RepID=A0ABY5PER0_9ACTN|nr:zinc ribbon domain-containing protein [Parviterribacteraceae bacterium J379]